MAFYFILFYFILHKAGCFAKRLPKQTIAQSFKKKMF